MVLLLKIHRWLAIVGVVVILYLGVTGSLIQVTDMHSIFARVSPYDPNLQAMHEDTNGPPNYAVIGPADYLSRALPASTDPVAMLTSVDAAARARLGSAPLSYVELRMQGTRLIGLVESGGQTLTFDARNGALLNVAAPAPFDEHQRESFRNTVKHLHRMTAFGDWALWINMIVAVILIALIVTGSWIYLRQLRARRTMGRTGLFWKTRDGWRTLHRVISIATGLFLAVVVLSGTWLTIESLGIAINGPRHLITLPSGQKAPAFLDPRLTTPLPDSVLAPMAADTLKAFHATSPGEALRVLRLRFYAGYAQGIVITDEKDPRQLVFNARTGDRMLLTEPGYPDMGLPLGWQVHQWAKYIHRGDAFGLPGRLMGLLAGFSMIYLSISGIVMYFELWNRRRKGGKTALLW